MPRKTLARLRVLTHYETIERIDSACDALVEAVTTGHEPPVTCRAGCSHCCHQPVFITPLEGLSIREAVRRAGRTEEIRERTAAYRRELESRPLGRSGLSALLKSVQGRGPEPTPEQRAAVFGPACPFLVDGLCSIYPVRPLMCREHISFDAVERCERDEPFFGLDKPRFEEVSAWLTQDAVPPREQHLPVWEYERAAEAAEKAPDVDAAELDEILRWKSGR